jgi:hypothetical protein
MRKQKRARNMESGKFGWDGMMTLQGDPQVATLSLRMIHNMSTTKVK